MRGYREEEYPRQAAIERLGHIAELPPFGDQLRSGVPQKRGGPPRSKGGLRLRDAPSSHNSQEIVVNLTVRVQGHSATFASSQHQPVARPN